MTWAAPRTAARAWAGPHPECLCRATPRECECSEEDGDDADAVVDATVRACESAGAAAGALRRGSVRVIGGARVRQNRSVALTDAGVDLGTLAGAFLACALVPSFAGAGNSIRRIGARLTRLEPAHPRRITGRGAGAGIRVVRA